MEHSPKSGDGRPHYSAKPGSFAPAARAVELVIPPACAGMRLDAALARLLPDWSRSRLQAGILEQRIRLEEGAALPRKTVWGGERVRIAPAASDGAEGPHAAEAIALAVIHEDDAILVIDKAPGRVVHPGNGNRRGTLLNALLHHAAHLAALPRAGIVHRLDKETSGLLMVAKTLEAQTSLVRQLQSRTVRREYLALVLGEVASGGRVDAPIGRHPVQRTRMAVTARGKEACTHYRVEERLDGCTLLRCSLETGRTHQIRVHMQALGHPLVGDPVYGGKPGKAPVEIARLIAGFPRQALHAQRLACTHPQHGGHMQWEAPLPCDMDGLLRALRQRREPEPAGRQATA